MLIYLAIWVFLAYTKEKRGESYENQKGYLIFKTHLDIGYTDYAANVKDLMPEPWFNLYNNIWNTIFPMRFGENVRFRFALHDRK